MTVVDLSFIDKPTDWRARERRRTEERHREYFRRAMLHLFDDLERAQDHCRALRNLGADVSHELEELVTETRAALLVARILQREAGHG